MSALPRGWTVAKLDDLAEYHNGAAFKPTDWGAEGMPIIRIQNLTDPSKPLNRTTRIVEDRLRVSDGDILVSWSATLDVFIWNRGEAWLNQHIFRVVPKEEIVDKRFLFYILRREIAILLETEHLHGSTMKHINRGPFLAHAIALPPLSEQRRIVAKLDVLAECSRTARDELERIPRLVKRYKQAVQSAVMETDDAGKAWPCVSLEKLVTDGPTNGYSPRTGENPNGTLSLKLTATTRGVMDLSERAVKRLNEVIPKQSKFWLKSGDVLIQRANSLEYVGMAAIFEGPSHKYIYPDLMIRIRFASPTLARWVWRYCSSAAGRRYFTSNATGTAGNMPKINGSTIREMQIPLPPTDQLDNLLTKVNRALDAIDALQREAARAHALLKRLDKSTLDKAFRGELSHKKA